MKIGSLFSGAGMLDYAVEEVFGAETVWHCEIDVAASKVLSERWPGVPNHVDVTRTVWADVEPVDILCGGFPCQDVSAAGRRAGIREGSRSGLWAVFADAIAALRPRIVVIENVRGLLSAEAHRAVESADATMGDGPGRPVLRAAGAVLGDLADLGYDAQWATVAAADVGAPHRRERVFIVATDASGERHGGWQDSRVVGRVDRQGEGEARQREWSRQLVGDRSATGDAAVDLLPTPQRRDGAGGKPEAVGRGRGYGPNLNDLAAAGELLPTPTSRDHKGANQRGDETCLTGALLPTPAASDGTGGGRHPDARAGHTSQIIDVALLHGSPQWGKYEPAIRRWEQLTRPAPSPTEPNTKGNPRLSAAFSEWMMGWPAGWVTAVPGISRNDALRIIGNGVVPQQATAALNWLLNVSEAVA